MDPPRLLMAGRIVSAPSASNGVLSEERCDESKDISTPYFVYILRCANGRYYTGHSHDPELRLHHHNEGRAARLTSLRGPAELLFKEVHPTRTEAIRREKQIKKWSRAKKEALIRGDLELLKNLSKSRDHD